MNDNISQPGTLPMLDLIVPHEFDLGDFAQDRISGMVGMIIGRTEFLHGEVRFGVLPINSVAQEHGGHGTNTHRALDWIDGRALRPAPAGLQKIIDQRRADHREQILKAVHAAAAEE